MGMSHFPKRTEKFEIPTYRRHKNLMVQMARIWVLKKHIAVRCTPFVLEDIWSISTDE